MFDPRQQQMMQQQQQMRGMPQQIPQHIQQQQMMQRQQQQQQQPPQQRKKPTDKSLSKKIESYVPESKLYMEMQDFERRLDATITRKTLDIQDSVSKPGKVIILIECYQNFEDLFI